MKEKGGRRGSEGEGEGRGGGLGGWEGDRVGGMVWMKNEME